MKTDTLDGKGLTGMQLREFCALEVNNPLTLQIKPYLQPLSATHKF
jgi:hypothetical protein